MTEGAQYRFLDAMGDVVVERSFDSHEQALAWACVGDPEVEGVQRVEYRGPQGDWRWAGALSG